MSSSTSITTAIPTPTSTSTTSTISSTTSSAPTSTQTTGDNGGGGDGGSGHPLLFFVALGFGVVFTNLWIIVGVKYCFRYNQRQRQAAIDAENGEPIDLTNMPRPRRRREKKLMSMDEVNERFPLIKYKLWRASREKEGLPAAGGVTAPPSRAASIKGAILERMSTEVDARPSAETSQGIVASSPPPKSSSDSKDFAVSHKEEKLPEVNEKIEEPNTPLPKADLNDEDDPISTAVPNELLQSPGDACAICIDTLDDDDEVRGLTCGHAFHAGCLDPWLTNRRACCPLCKADYYVPKPRANGEPNPENTSEAPAHPVIYMNRSGFAHRGRVGITGSRFRIDSHDRFGFPILTRNRPSVQQTTEANQATNGPVSTTNEASEVQQQPSMTMRAGRMFRSIPGFRRQEATSATADANTNQAAGTPTPGALEAGTR